MPRDPRPRQRGQRAEQIKPPKPARDRRSLEAYATSRWADLRQKDKHAYVTDIIALGDFNLPKVVPSDSVYDALLRRGLRRPQHSSKIASSIASDKRYDQIMFFPGQTKHEFSGNSGVFDYDGAIFAKLWQTKTKAQFRAYLRYYISDHRPIVDGEQNVLSIGQGVWPDVVGFLPIVGRRQPLDGAGQRIHT